MGGLLKVSMSNHNLPVHRIRRRSRQDNCQQEMSSLGAGVSPARLAGFVSWLGQGLRPGRDMVNKLTARPAAHEGVDRRKGTRLVARIAGVNIPTNKRVAIALRYIHGIGPKKLELYGDAFVCETWMTLASRWYCGTPFSLHACTSFTLARMRAESAGSLRIITT